MDTLINKQARFPFLLVGTVFIGSFVMPTFGQEPGSDPELFVDELIEQAADATSELDVERAKQKLAEASMLMETWDYPEVAQLYDEIGDIYSSLGKLDTQLFVEAQKNYERSLSVNDPQRSSFQASKIRFKIGRAQIARSQYDKAIKTFTQVIETRRSTQKGLVSALANLGSAYVLQGNFGKAWFAYEEALDILNRQKHPSQVTLRALTIDSAMVATEIGDYGSAIEKLQAVLDQSKTESDTRNQARAEFHLGYAYFNQGRQFGDNEAIAQSTQHFALAVQLHEDAQRLSSLGRSLNNLGYAYAYLGEHERALEALNRSLEISSGRDRTNICRTLDSIGFVYLEQDESDQALGYFFDALLCARGIGDLAIEHVTLANLGRVFEEQEPALAITFLKQSIAVIERIRADLEPLSVTAKQTFADKMASVYRLLADLLLTQGRAAEAERAIDSLRAEELNAFLGGLRGGEDGVPNLEGEVRVWEQYSSLLARSILEARDLADLRAIELNQRTPAQQLRLEELRQNQIKAKKQFTELQNQPEVKAELESMASLSDFELIDVGQLLNISEYLLPNEVLFYPLVLDERLELLFVTSDAVPVSIQKSFKRSDLHSKVSDFRNALRHKTDEVVSLGQELYAVLLKPLDAALAEIETNDQIDIDTIIYVPDGFLRYLPLSALHDGNDWIARRYATSIITSTSLSEISSSPIPIDRILAGAFTEPKTIDRLDGTSSEFAGLPYAEQEVSDLKTLYPNSNIFLAEEFQPDNFVIHFEDYQAVHLATHGEFAPMRPAQFSFILYGDGRRASLEDIEREWLMKDVDLVALSACETGIGGVLGNGNEIHGFGYLIQKSGANAALASLWKVSDSGTHALMSTFYRALKSEAVGKSKALQQAQLALIDDQLPTEVNQLIRGAHPVDQPPLPDDFSHPFYWAPFVLIGNSR